MRKYSKCVARNRIWICLEANWHDLSRLSGELFAGVCCGYTIAGWGILIVYDNPVRKNSLGWEEICEILFWVYFYTLLLLTLLIGSDLRNLCPNKKIYGFKRIDDVFVLLSSIFRLLFTLKLSLYHFATRYCVDLDQSTFFKTLEIELSFPWTYRNQISDAVPYHRTLELMIDNPKYSKLSRGTTDFLVVDSTSADTKH